ncbi:MAG TPA: tripartite tricarboxylate transporter substrate binding protein [Burkholderiales bacterium]|nr:tripartite tricarboxylate transporter substrate binding protein [Burkholderiales bacterium]
MKLRLASCIAALLCSVFVAAAHAQQGAKPLRMIIPFPPGGSLDVVGRLLGHKVTEMTGRNVIIDNRSGASGNIGTELAKNAPPDGATVMLNTLPFVVNPALFGKAPYDPVKDFAPVSLIASGPHLLVVHPTVPAKNFKELLALARAKPGRMNYSSAGNGTNLHIPAELLKSLAGIDIVHVPYKGGGPALTAVLGGEVDMSFINLVPVLPHLQSGRLRAIAVTSAKRSVTLPKVPTIAESGIPGYEFTTWWALLAPAATPPTVIAELNDAVVKAVKSPDFSERMVKEGGEAIGSTPEQLGAHIRSEVAKWSKLVRDRGLKAD